MDMEQHIPKPVWQGQECNQEECNHNIIQWKGSLYLETDTWGVGLRGASLPQGRDEMWFLRNEAPDSTMLCQKHLQAKDWQVQRPTTAT